MLRVLPELSNRQLPPPGAGSLGVSGHLTEAGLECGWHFVCGKPAHGPIDQGVWLLCGQTGSQSEPALLEIPKDRGFCHRVKRCVPQEGWPGGTSVPHCCRWDHRANSPRTSQTCWWPEVASAQLPAACLELSWSPWSSVLGLSKAFEDVFGCRRIRATSELKPCCSEIVPRVQSQKL